MKTYRYVEEYIEIIAGIRDPITNKTNVSFLSVSPLSLARYDVNVIASLGEQVSIGGALTDRQAELCVKIVSKYEKQLAKLGVDVTPIQNPVYRVPLRQMDRTKTLTIEDNFIYLKFPYIESLVQSVKTFAKESQGRCHFEREQKRWKLGLTEYNINWAVNFAKTNEFEIGSDAEYWMTQILECEKNPYEIKLTVDDERLIITNAAAELIEYIEQHLGGFDLSNVLNLIDHSDILGYTVDSVFEEYAISESSPRVYNLMLNRDSKLEASNIDNTFSDIVHYAERSNRWPIYIYEPNLSGRLLTLATKHFGEQDVINIDKNNYSDGARVIYFTKYNSQHDQRIPLLISTMGMLFGGDKQLLLDRAEKVVYLTPEVYNRSSRGARSVNS